MSTPWRDIPRDTLVYPKCAHYTRFVNFKDPDYVVPAFKDATVWDIMGVPPVFFWTAPKWESKFTNLHWCVYWEDINGVGIEDEPHMLLCWCREEERLHLLGGFDKIWCTEVIIDKGSVSIGREMMLTMDDIIAHRVEMTNRRCEWFITGMISNWNGVGMTAMGLISKDWYATFRRRLRKKAKYQKYKDLIGLRTKDLVQLATKGLPDDNEMHSRRVRGINRAYRIHQAVPCTKRKNK